MLIPKIIHQFWTGGPMPAAYRRFIAGWKALHPEWEFILWGEERPIPKLKNQDIYDRAAEIVSRHIIPLQSDILRYELLYQFGGVWVDTDIEPVRSVDELLEGLEAFATWELQDNVAANGFMGCTKGHPLVKALVDGLGEAVARRKSKAAAVITGPHYLTSKLTPDVVMLPQKYFFPYEHRETDAGWHKDYPEAYGIHHFGSAEHLLDIPVVRRNAALPAVPPTDKPRVVVLAQGESTRWDNYTGVPKHLVNVEGETVLARAARLFSERGCDVVVVGPPDERYRVDGAQSVTLAAPDLTGTSADKVLATYPLWAKNRRTILVNGDCYYTEGAADTIVESKKADVEFVCRFSASELTGCPWGESYALSFAPKHHHALLQAAERAVEQSTGDVHLWMVYAAYKGVDTNEYHDLEPYLTEIDDWSDDFDFPADYREWMKRWGTRLPVSIVIMAHPDRREWAEALAEEVGAKVIYDRGEGHIDTALRCLEAYDPKAVHHIILQDDAIPAKGFVEMAERVAAVVGPEPVCFYAGRGSASYATPAKDRFEAAQRTGASWFTTEGPFWAVGVSHPVVTLPEVVELFKADNAKGDDTRLMAAYKKLGLRCWYPVPTLVDHRDGRSLIWKSDGKGRVAIAWVEDAAAFDPYGEVLAHDWQKATGENVYRHKRVDKVVRVPKGRHRDLYFAKHPDWEPV